MVHDPEHTSSGERGSVKIILLVEDDDSIGEVLVQAITQETAYLVILVPDGIEALQKVKSIKPNLFILDYQLPRINGIELYDQLHAIEEFTQTPTIMMSARLPEKELVGRNIVGMNKPIDLDEFLHTIDELLA
jgi:DNA-binding response OmpR family regulator